MITAHTILDAMRDSGEEVEKLGQVWDSLLEAGDPKGAKREW